MRHNKCRRDIWNHVPHSTGDQTRWLAASLVLSCIVVAMAAAPTMRNPQLEPDDYRYLHHVQLLNQSLPGNFLKASVVENRWDHLWWIDIERSVRFFRPIVVLSYWFDSKLYGSEYKLGLFITNAIIYALCVVLVCVILFRWLSAGAPLLISSLLFASFAAHSEVMWYVAGRTDSIAGLLFLAALGLHVYGAKRSTLRWWAVLCYVGAALTKELVLPLLGILFLHDLWIERRSERAASLLRAERRLYSVYTFVAIAILGIHLQIGSAGNAGYPYPYFTTPQHPDFPIHVWSQLQSYSATALFARWTIPFLAPREVPSTVGLVALLLGIVLLAAVSFELRRDRKYWILLLLAIGSWLPIISVYLSERYLFLPSFAIAGAAGLLLARTKSHRPALYPVMLSVAVLWMGYQAYHLQENNKTLSAFPRRTDAMEQQLMRLRPAIAKGARLLLLNMPGAWLDAQFAQDLIRVVLDDPTVEPTIITMMPRTNDMGSRVSVSKENSRTVRLETLPRLSVVEHHREPCPQVQFKPGSTYVGKSGIQVDILRGNGITCRALRFTVPDSLSAYLILKWTPDPNRLASPHARELRSKVEIITL